MKLVSIVMALLSGMVIFLQIVLFKKNKISFQTLVVWVLLWGIIAFAFLFPYAINSVSNLFGMNNRMFFVFTVSIIFLFLITFLNFIKIRQNELTNIKIIQQMSLLASTLDELKDKVQSENDRDDSRL